MTLLKFSTSALRLTTSVGDIDDLTPDREPVPEPELGDSGSVLDAVNAAEPVADDADTEVV